jgi:hypothetical protein
LVVSGVEEGTHRNAFSLAGLPGLLTALAEGEEVMDVASEYAVSATRQGSRTAFHTSGPDYIESTKGAEVSGANGLSESQIEQFREVAGQVVYCWEESNVERCRISESVDSVISEGSI